MRTHPSIHYQARLNSSLTPIIKKRFRRIKARAGGNSCANLCSGSPPVHALWNLASTEATAVRWRSEPDPGQTLPAGDYLSAGNQTR